MDILPRNDKIINEHKELLDRFNRFDFLFIDVGSSNKEKSVSTDQLIEVADRVAEELSSSAIFKEVRYKWDMGDISIVMDAIKRRRAFLFTEEDKKKVEEKIKYDSIKEIFIQWKKLLTESPVPMLSQSFRSDPLSIDALFFDKLKPFKAMGRSIKMEKGRIFSSDMQHIMILALPVYSGSDNLHAKEIVDFMEEMIGRLKGNMLKASHEAGSYLENIDIAYMGSHRFNLENAAIIKSDIKRTMAITIVAIILLSALVYKKPLLTALTLTPALFGGAFAAGIIAIFSPGISAISIGCGSILIGIAVDYGIHLLYHFDRLPDNSNRSAVTALLNKLYLPIFIGAGTTVIAFLTLQLSVIPGYKQLGLFAATGITGAVLFSIIVLPLLIPLNKKSSRKRAVLELTDFYPHFFSWAANHKTLLLTIITIFSIVAILGLFKVELDGDLQKLNAVSGKTKKDWKLIIDTFGEAMSSTSIAVKAETIEKALEINDNLYAEIKKFKKEGFVKSDNSIARIIPGRKTQQENLLRWQLFWNNERIEKLQKDVTKVCLDLGIRPDVFETVFSGMREEVETELKLDDLKVGFLKNIISNQIAEDEDQTLIQTNLKLNSFDDFQKIKETIEAKFPGLIITNDRFFVNHMVELVYSELKRLGIVAIIAVAVLLLFYTRKSRDFFRLLSPLVLSLLWTFGTMGWLGININLMNAVVVIFIFGLVIDYSVFLHAAWKNRDSETNSHLSCTGGAITISALTTICGLGSMLFADHPALHSIGATVLLGIGSGFTAVLLVIPSGFLKK